MTMMTMMQPINQLANQSFQLFTAALDGGGGIVNHIIMYISLSLISLSLYLPRQEDVRVDVVAAGEGCDGGEGVSVEEDGCDDDGDGEVSDPINVASGPVRPVPNGILMKDVYEVDHDVDNEVAVEHRLECYLCVASRVSDSCCAKGEHPEDYLKQQQGYR
eukprot:GHVU01026622.1.p1 GENE.GHVU01026622.1~~GHVU01026622.1.p1  ORF type:complete len:161 (+),score=17.76 GHVU01026622.1:957-1439(+)